MHLDILPSPDGKIWIKLFSYLRHVPFGLDGQPLIVPVADKTPCQFVKLRLRNEANQHLDEVEVYARPTTTPGVPSLPRPAIAHRAEHPVIHINSLNGNLANRMLQYMAALRLREHVPDAVLSNVQLPEWSIETPVAPPNNARTIRVTAVDQFDIARLAEKLRAGATDFVMIGTGSRTSGSIPTRNATATSSHRSRNKSPTCQYLARTN